jgi:hypothetical protein
VNRHPRSVIAGWLRNIFRGPGVDWRLSISKPTAIVHKTKSVSMQVAVKQLSHRAVSI